MTPDGPTPEAPPRAPSSRSWPLPLVLALGCLGVLGLAVLFLFDPAHHALYPVCLFKKLTGYDCPGCGGLRAVHRLLRGEVWQAFQLNAMVVLAVPLLAVWGLRAWRHSGEPPSSQCGRRRVWFGAWLLVSVVLLFSVLRNLPFWPFGVTPM